MNSRNNTLAALSPGLQELIGELAAMRARFDREGGGVPMLVFSASPQNYQLFVARGSNGHAIVASCGRPRRQDGPGGFSLFPAGFPALSRRSYDSEFKHLRQRADALPPPYTIQVCAGAARLRTALAQNGAAAWTVVSLADTPPYAPSTVAGLIPLVADLARELTDGEECVVAATDDLRGTLSAHEAMRLAALEARIPSAMKRQMAGLIATPASRLVLRRDGAFGLLLAEGPSDVWSGVIDTGDKTLLLTARCAD